MKSIEIDFIWVPVQSSKSVQYSFPQPVTKQLRREYSRPAVYRWLVQRGDKTRVYIGETERLDRRLNHYLKPGPSQKTNQRLKVFFDAELAGGASISLDVLDFESFMINGREYSPEKLWEKDARCFLENLLITLLPSEIEKLNQLISVQEKILCRAAKALRPDLSAQVHTEAARGAVKQLKLQENKRSSQNN